MDPTLKLHADIDVMEQSPLLRGMVLTLATAPLVTLLRNALPGNDRKDVRQPQGLAARLNPL